MSGALDGKVALVTGGARGIGEAIARLFCAEGARVAVADVNESGGQALVQELGAAAFFAGLDVTDEAAWQAAIDAVVARWGRFDALVNNAGIIARKALLETSVADMDAAYRVNQLGVFLGMKTAAPALQASGGGAIVNLSSAAGLVARPGVFAYSATKWAVRGMTKAAAAELGPLGIRVNSILPCQFLNAGLRGLVADPARRRTVDRMIGGIPMGRMGEPEEVVGPILFLASPASSMVTGANLPVDGGNLAFNAGGSLPEMDATW